VTNASRSLDEQKREFASRRFLAMPLAGCIAWIVIGMAGATLPPFPATMVLFVSAGSIAYLGMFLSRFTGEHILAQRHERNAFDSLFFHTVGMALLVFAIAIPFFPRGLHVTSVNGRHSHRADVGSCLLAHRALDRHRARACTDGWNRGGLVPLAGCSLHCNTDRCRVGIRSDDRRTGEKVAPCAYGVVGRRSQQMGREDTWLRKGPTIRCSGRAKKSRILHAQNARHFGTPLI